jgi:hypothetical protein
MKKKYLFVSLHIQNGEYEHYSNSVHVVDETTDSEKFAEDHAGINFYGSENYKEDNAYYYFGGSIAVSVNDFREISEEDFNVLSRFL